MPCAPGRKLVKVAESLGIDMGGWI